MIESSSSHNWLTWSLPLLILGLILLLFSILGMVRKIKRAELFRIPLQQETIFEFKDGGDFRMYLEGPRFSRIFSGLRYQMINAANQSPILLSRTIIPFRTSTMGRVSSQYAGFQIDQPGKYILRVEGLSGRNLSEASILFRRPVMLSVVLYIGAIVLTGGAAITGLVMSIIHWSRQK